MIGKEDNQLLISLLFSSRKRDKPLHLISHGSNGQGKTLLQESVADLIPPQDVKTLTSLSDNAFYYCAENELQHKLVLIEDLDGLGSDALYAMPEPMSKQQITRKISQRWALSTSFQRRGL